MTLTRRGWLGTILGAVFNRPRPKLPPVAAAQARIWAGGAQTVWTGSRGVIYGMQIPPAGFLTNNAYPKDRIDFIHPGFRVSRIDPIGRTVTFDSPAPVKPGHDLGLYCLSDQPGDLSRSHAKARFNRVLRRWQSKGIRAMGAAS